MSNTSTIHIKTDFDCKVYDYGQELGTAKADNYFNVELRKGEHELSFIYTKNESISKTISYNVIDTDCDYKLHVEIAEIICGIAKKLTDSSNITAAIKLYAIAAKKGYALAQFKIGSFLYEAKDYLKAVEWFTNAAEQGFAEAQFNLGICYYYGYGIEKDFAKAVEWFTNAAKQGDVVAQYNLGVCFYKGIGVEKDFSKAVEWYTKAAEKNQADAQFNLGICFENGTGVEKNLTKALEWYTKAAIQGDVDAQYNLGYCYEYGDGIEKKLSKAVEWYTKAAEQGFARAQCNLGVCYEHGTGVEKDLAKAVEWYTKAAEQGDSTAQHNLGYCYEKGNGIEKSLPKAVEWYTKAAEQGYAKAQCILSIYYAQGKGVDKDFAKAIIWCNKAVEQGYAKAQYLLGVYYYKGIGVEKNLSKAMEWYTKAAEQGEEDAKKAIDRLKSIETKPIHYLFFDTETTGLPIDYNTPTYQTKLWPRLVQLSWITTDEDCNILSQNDFIIYPDGFTIPSDASKLHGITTDIAKEKGKPLKEVMDKFMEDFKAAKAIVGHNIDFDKKILSAELYRLKQKDIMNSKQSLCTMKASTNFCKIPGPYGYKHPKLQELHKKLFGCEFKDAHNSMSDVTATLKCFKEMRRVGWI